MCPFGLLGTPKHLSTDRDAVGIDRPILVRPVKPPGYRIGEGTRIITCFGKRITPVNHCTRIIVPHDANMSVARLFIRHRFAVLAARASWRTVSLEKLICVPLAICRHPRRLVRHALPENEAHPRTVEPNDDVRILAHSPHSIPRGLKLQRARIGPESPRPRWTSWKPSPRQDISGRSMYGRVQVLNLLGGQ